MTTIESATRLVAEAMATTALDYDVLADDGIDGLSAHEVLIEYSDDSEPAGTLTPDFMDAAREYVNMVFANEMLDDDEWQELGSNLYIFHAYPLAEHELDIEPGRRIDDLYSSELSQSGVLTITTSSAVHRFNLNG